MAEKMLLHNQFLNEFIDDELAWSTYLESVIPEEFERIAATKGMHLVPGSIREQDRQALVLVPVPNEDPEESYMALRPKTPFFEGYEDADMTGIIWVAYAEA